MEWTDDGIVLGTRRHGESQRHRRGDDARSRPPSRARSRRQRLAASPAAAAGQHRAGGVAREARRASRPLRGRAAPPARRLAAWRLAYRLWRDAPGRALPAAAGARSAPRGARSACGRCSAISTIRRWPRSKWSASNCRCSPSWASASTLKAAPRPARRTISAMCRRNPAARCRGSRRRRGRTGCSVCRRFCRTRSRRRPTILPTALRLTGFFLARHVLEPRGLAFADAREGFVAAVLGRRPAARLAQ